MIKRLPNPITAMTGPILAKELRVTSRRSRYFALRTVLIGLLVVMLCLVWYETISNLNNVSAITANLAQAGIGITIAVIWFEFIVCQIVALVGLSTSISDEISHQTLGVMMTTPITSLQVVLGKLWSQLLLICVLIGVTLPVLAIIRVFGGIPWWYILSSFSVILATCLFVGSVSLVLSIYARKAYIAIIAAILTLVLIYAILPIVFAIYAHEWLRKSTWLAQGFQGFLYYTNPYVHLFMQSIQQKGARGVNVFLSDGWLIHCAVLISLSGILILWATIRVRAIGLRQITGGGKAKSKKKGARQAKQTEKIRHVKGCPIQWKELRQPLWGRHRKRTVLLLTLILIILGLMYGGLHRSESLEERITHIMFGLFLMGAGFLYTTVIPATMISSERESRSLPILLCTTLTTGQIMRGKWLGAMRQSFPAWILLIGHLLFFTLSGYIHILGLPLMLLALCGPIFFVIGMGLFFSTWYRKTTTAVIVNMLLAGIIWIVLPYMIAMFFRLTGTNMNFFEGLICFNPLVQVVVLMETLSGHGSKIVDFDWPIGNLRLVSTIGFLAVSSAMYTGVGLFFAFIASQNLRVRALRNL